MTHIFLIYLLSLLLFSLPPSLSPTLSHRSISLSLHPSLPHPLPIYIKGLVWCKVMVEVLSMELPWRSIPPLPSPSSPSHPSLPIHLSHTPPPLPQETPRYWYGARWWVKYYPWSCLGGASLPGSLKWRTTTCSTWPCLTTPNLNWTSPI